MAENIIDRNVLDMYISDMQIYAIALNRKQSVPDVRDGLKTVDRRVITDMYFDKHLTYDKNYIKSAGTVGSTMEKYHPHGDCISSSTHVYCTSGEVYTIKELYDKTINEDLYGIKIFAVDPKTGEINTAIAHNFRIGQYTNKIYHIELYTEETNFTGVISCTSNHPFLNSDREFIKAEDLEIGMRLYCLNCITIGSLSCIVSNIVIEEVDNEPMYDFTVDNYENMLIPMINDEGVINNFICAHNSSIYDVLVKLACWWKTKIPLISGHGNFGNMQGDGAAAMRYTESKLSEFCCDAVIADLQKSKDIVDWVPNFDESAMEPEYLPCKVPLLLINGTFGIGIGMRAEISRHNPGEVIQAVLDVIKDPEAPVVLIPDHSMPCDIVDTNWKKICNTGFGTYRCRGRVDIETTKIGRNEYQMLVIKSVPDNVTLSQSSGLEDKGIVATIDKLIKEGKLTGIKDHFDDSKGTNMRYCIVLKENTDPKYIRDFLYKHTRLEDTFRENFEVLEGIKPMRMSFKSYIEYFIQFSINMKRRTYYSLLSQAKTKWREKQLYIMVIESGEIDNIQKKIKGMKDVSIEARNEFMEYLIKKFKVTDIEAKFIMNMDQMKTAKGYLKIYKEESKQLEADIQTYLNKLTDNDTSIKQEIVAELEYFKKKYNMPRVCRVVKDTGEDIPAGEFLVVVTENNKIRKMNVGTAVNSVRGDSPKFILKMDNRDNVLLYDKNGKIFKLPVHKINLCDKSMAGQDIRILIKNCTSDIITIMKESSVATLANKVKKYFLVVMTTAGCIKKMDLDDFLKVPPSGILYTKLLDGDSVKDIAIVPNSVDLVVYSHKKALRFDVETQVPHYKRSALGVSAMNSKDGVDGFSIIGKDAQSIVVITKSGKMNKFDVTGLANKKRNQAGSSVIKLGKTDMIQNILGVKETDIIKIGTSTGVVEVPVKDLSIGSSISAGQKVLNSKAGIILDSKVK